MEDVYGTHYLLTCLSEECSEVTKQACKSIRFGLDSKYTGITNAETIMQEFYDLWAVIELLQDQGALRKYSEEEQKDLKEQKKFKIYKNYQ